MKMLVAQSWRFALWRDRQGQDMIEYALLAGFIAVAVGALSPALANSMTLIYSRLASKLVDAGG
jgi:pilus assembly protein Flp/PilA